MKQSEFDRELKGITKAEAKNRRWKSVDVFCYWSIGPLFFVFVPTARIKERSFNSTLRFKWFDLDRALWEILDMRENEKAPFSLHANGAFVLHGREILASTTHDVEWMPGRLEQEVTHATDEAARRAQELAGLIDGLDSYLAFLQADTAAVLQRHPQAKVDVWRETLLAAWLRHDMRTVEGIARERIAANDRGGFGANDMSFYENALHLCMQGRASVERL
ncbi:hypothetical protein LQ564_20850 [Massilia sp. G4R7]|uniref:Uncharacterized protein n=1 Tax=Massilia phyllostachyos TaxID=2898585 RepID=A0ABS8QAH9_9BURK|nr:hypothetical protein [Massilia phyllostachyos]MCD2518751.1 hypothetical protein [Massilia phyllostachyos]